MLRMSFRSARLTLSPTQRAHTRLPSNPVRVRFDAFELDESNALLLRNGKAVTLAPKPFAVLCALARRPGSLLTKHALLDDVWGHQFVTDSVLKTAISEVRAALDDDPKQPRYIETVSRRGYRFIAPTSAAFTPAPVRALDLSGSPSFYAVERLVLGGKGGAPATPVCFLWPSNAM